MQPGNLLLTSNGYLAMCDLNLCQQLDLGGRAYRPYGTPQYQAPEQQDNGSGQVVAGPGGWVGGGQVVAGPGG